LLGSCQIAGSLIEEPISPEMPASVYKSNPPGRKTGFPAPVATQGNCRQSEPQVISLMIRRKWRATRHEEYVYEKFKQEEPA
jgi:hypothetical protein